jgi:hypothetical protein
MNADIARGSGFMNAPCAMPFRVLGAYQYMSGYDSATTRLRLGYDSATTNSTA